MAPAKRVKTGGADTNRDSKGRFVAGNKANPRGRAPLPPDFRRYAEKAPEELWAIANAEDTPVKVRADILKWMSEMWYGKAPQALDLDGKVDSGGAVKVEFTGILEEWSQ